MARTTRLYIPYLLLHGLVARIARWWRGTPQLGATLNQAVAAATAWLAQRPIGFGPSRDER